VLKALGGSDIQDFLKRALGGALILAAGAIVTKGVLGRRREERPDAVVHPPLRRGITIAIGAVGGLLVGMTSVGSGSLIVVMLLFAYPALKSSELVGTDLIQAIPLVASATLGHLLFGDVRLGLTVSLLIGAVPGVYAGARLSAHAPDKAVRPALFAVLLASGLKLAFV
jgi:uncharacterized membrane protein YfcA